ncbi:MAG: hypothetical protein KC503_18120 [Myxococcales bacterium]|nr:hypothetical protein [Myxococcales bacterium]
MSKKLNTNSKTRKLILTATAAALCLPLLAAGSAEARPGYSNNNRKNAHSYNAPRAAAKRTPNRAPARQHIGVKRHVLKPGPRVIYRNGRRVVQPSPRTRVIVRPARRTIVTPARFGYAPAPVKVCRTISTVEYREMWFAGLRVTMAVPVEKNICTLQPAPSSYVYNF